VFVEAVEGVTTEIRTENAFNIELLTKKVQFVGLGRRVEEFVSQHPHVEDIQFKSAITDLQRWLVGQDRELCQFAEANGWARAEQDSELDRLRGVIAEVATKQRHERKKASGL
jgi:hypothetical protein